MKISQLDILRLALSGVRQMYIECQENEKDELLELSNELNRRIHLCMRGLAQHNMLILCTVPPRSAT